MDSNKVVDNIVKEAFDRAEKNGDPKYVVAEAVLEVYLREAIDAIESRGAKWFYDMIKSTTRTDMKIYVGRWDYLPAYIEGYSGLMEMSEEEIKSEMIRQWDEYKDNDFINVYTPEEFEETFNDCLTHFIDSKKYWIRIF